jgi:hypothetical protein
MSKKRKAPMLSPKHASYFHGLMVIVWIIMIPIAVFTGLKNSVPFLVFISVLALVFSELAAWQGAMGERRQDPHDKYGEEE